MIFYNYNGQYSCLYTFNLFPYLITPQAIRSPLPPEEGLSV